MNLLQTVTCPQCGHKSYLDHDYIVELGDVLECGNHNCSIMFQPDDTNTETFSWDGVKLVHVSTPDNRGPTDRDLRNA